MDLNKFYAKFVTSKDSIVEGNLSGDFNNLVIYSGNKDEINRFLESIPGLIIFFYPYSCTKHEW